MWSSYIEHPLVYGGLMIMFRGICWSHPSLLSLHLLIKKKTKDKDTEPRHGSGSWEWKGGERMATTMAVATKPFFSLGVEPRGGNKFLRRFHAFEAIQRKSLQRMRFLLPSPSCPPRALHDGRNAQAEAAEMESSPSATPEGDDDSSYSVLTCMTSQHNNIVIVDTPKSRFLLLDSSRKKFRHLRPCSVPSSQNSVL